jgi:hypothetical protein
MPAIAMFYGILIRLFYKDTDWNLAVAGEKPFPIRGLE